MPHPSHYGLDSHQAHFADKCLDYYHLEYLALAVVSVVNAFGIRASMGGVAYFR